MDGLGGVLGLEEEELGHDDVRSIVGDGPVDADDSFLEEAGEDVVGALASRRVLYDHGNQAVPAHRLVRPRPCGSPRGYRGCEESGA